MPLMPKRTKFRKQQKGRNRGKATRGNVVNEGEFGLQATTAGWIKSNQIEAARVAMTRFTKRGGKVYKNIFPHLSLTKKPLETRQGKGKGSHDAWVAVVKEGKIMFEMSGVEEAVAREAFRLASHKLPIKCKFVKKESGVNND